MVTIVFVIILKLLTEAAGALCASLLHPVSYYLNNKMVTEEIRTLLRGIFTYSLT